MSQVPPGGGHAAPGAVDPVASAAVRALAAPLAARLAARGHRCYLVGGLVRDLHLGRVDVDALGDVDVTTDATPDVVKAALGDLAVDLWTQGERFGTIGLHVERDGGGLVEFEITTHRAEHYDPSSRKPVVEFAEAIDADLSRRDFTVNAMAMELPDGELVDPFAGLADLRAGILRTPAAPEVSFTDDPLRMLRAARFHAGYGLEPTDELEAAMAALRDRLAIVSRERIREELAKLLALDAPGRGIELLGRTGLLAEVVAGYDVAAAPVVAEVVDAVPPEPLVRRAAFLLLHAQRHGDAGARSLLAALRYSGKEQRDTARVLAVARDDAHLRELGTDDRGVRTFLAAAGDVADATLELLAIERLAGAEAVGRFAARRADLARREPLDDLGPALDGTEVMEVLGTDSGPVVGDALALLREIRLSEGPIDRDEARRRVGEWARSRSLG